MGKIIGIGFFGRVYIGSDIQSGEPVRAATHGAWGRELGGALPATSEPLAGGAAPGLRPRRSARARPRPAHASPHNPRAPAWRAQSPGTWKPPTRPGARPQRPRTLPAPGAPLHPHLQTPPPASPQVAIKIMPKQRGKLSRERTLEKLLLEVEALRTLQVRRAARGVGGL